MKISHTFLISRKKQGIAPALPARRASPLATRVALAHGIDLSTINAPGSRITRADVDLHLAQGSQPLQTPHAPMRQTEQIDGTIKEAASVPASGLRLSSTPSAPAQWDVIHLKGLRRATAIRMASVRQIPAGCAIVEADVTVPG